VGRGAVCLLVISNVRFVDFKVDSNFHII